MPAVHEAPFDAGWTTTVPVGDPALARILEALAPLHPRLCPRQVLGARIGLQGGRLLRLALPQVSGQKRLLSFVETDGCFLDGVAAATGCSVGHRTMRIVDQGKVAVTFVDNATGHAVRVWPRGDARQQALAYAACDRSNRWLAQRDGYLRLPANGARPRSIRSWSVIHLAVVCGSG